MEGFSFLPAGVATVVLEFLAVDSLLFLREIGRPFKGASEGNLERLHELLGRAHHLTEVAPLGAEVLPGYFQDGLAFGRMSSEMLEALARLRAVESLLKVRVKWRCINTVEQVDEYLDDRLCRAPGFWTGPGREVYAERERKELPALFSACQWLLRCMITAPAPKTLRFYHAFVETMGVDGMGADGLPMQLPLLCWEPAS